MNKNDINRQAYLKKRADNNRSKSVTKKLRTKWQREDAKGHERINRRGK